MSEQNKVAKSIKIKLDEGAYMPTKAHRTDAGIDLYTPREVTVTAKGSVIIDTGVHIQLPRGTYGLLASKSGLNVKHGITSTGVIDFGYTGSIVAKLYNNSNEDYKFQKGDKITQLIIMKLYPVSLCQTDEEFEASERGDNGFGSSGR